MCFFISIGEPGEILNRITKMNYTICDFKAMSLILKPHLKINAIVIIILALLVKKAQHTASGIREQEKD